MLPRLLLFVWLPTVCWCARLTPEFFPETGYLESGTLAAFRGGGWTSVYCDSAARPFDGGMKRRAAMMLPDPDFTNESDELWIDPMPDSMLPTASRNPGSSASAMDVTAERRRSLLAMDKSVNYAAGFDRGTSRPAVLPIALMSAAANSPVPRKLIEGGKTDAAAVEPIAWGRSTSESLALCFVGLLAMIPHIMNRRNGIGDVRKRQRRSTPVPVT
jgi:hypothetical protein